LINGISDKEFVKSKSEHLKSIIEQDTTKIPYWMDNIREHFIYGEILPSAKKLLLKDIIKDLTLVDLNQYMATLINNKIEEVDIIMLAPPEHKALSYSEKEIRGWIQDAGRLSLAQYDEPSIPSKLISLDTLHN